MLKKLVTRCYHMVEDFHKEIKHTQCKGGILTFREFDKAPFEQDISCVYNWLRVLFKLLRKLFQELCVLFEITPEHIFGNISTKAALAKSLNVSHLLGFKFFMHPLISGVDQFTLIFVTSLYA